MASDYENLSIEELHDLIDELMEIMDEKIHAAHMLRQPKELIAVSQAEAISIAKGEGEVWLICRDKREKEVVAEEVAQLFIASVPTDGNDSTYGIGVLGADDGFEYMAEQDNKHAFGSFDDAEFVVEFYHLDS